MDLTIDMLRSAQAALSGQTIRTPVLSLRQAAWGALLGGSTDVTIKLELFQQAGSFKARGAFLGIAGLDDDQRRAGVVAASGGNHAMAVAWAARAAGVTAQITMPHHVDPERIAACKDMGAKVSLHADISEAFAEMEQIAQGGAVMMHPFEAAHMILGSATCAAEFLEQAPEIDTMIVPVGGGGLIAGIAAAAKRLRPDMTVIGVEPEGADSVSRSLAAGRPVALDKVDTIADSLGAPMAMPMSFDLIRSHVDDVVRVPDSALVAGMVHLRRVLRLMAEPACAASLAALIGPLRDRLEGKRVGLIACGSNISLDRFNQLLGEAADAE